jgi:hypothetical protein
MAGFTTGQANSNLQQLVNTPTEYSGDVQDLARSQRLAELLSAGKPAEGQMVSGRFVAPSWTQNLAGLAQAGLSAYYGDKAETQQAKLAEKLRQDKMMTQEGIMTAIDKGDMKKALSIAATRPEYGKEFIAPLIGNVIPKAQEPKVVGNNLVGPDGKVIFTAPKEFAPHAPQMVQTENGMMMFDPNNRSFTPATMNGQQIMPPMDAGAKSDLRANQTQQKVIGGAIKAVTDTPTAFGWTRGAKGTVLGESISNRTETEAETAARSYVFNIVSKVIHDRAGASQTPSEIAKINRFLPNEYDNAKKIKDKLEGFEKFLKDEASGITQPTVRAGNQTTATPPPAANRKVEKEGTVQDGPNKGKRAIQYSDGTIEYK